MSTDSGESDTLSSTTTSSFPFVNLGPLTTTFTMPTKCTVPVIAAYTGGDLYLDFAKSCASGASIADLSCWPPATRADPTTGFYSPGYICPSGYVIACSQSPVVSSSHVFFTGDFSFLRQPLEKEIAIGCCPTGFACAMTSTGNYQTQFCFGLTISTMITGVPCAAMEGTNNGLTSTAFFGSSTTTFDLGYDEIDLYAPLFQLLYHSSDLPHTSNFADTSDSFRSQPASTQPNNYGNATITLTTASPPAPKVRGTPSGAIAGIAIGGLLGLGLLITLIWFLLLWRQRQKKRRYGSSSESIEGPKAKGPKAELPGQANQIHEVDAREKPKELPSATTYLAQELEAPNFVHELHGDTARETLVIRVCAELE